MDKHKTVADYIEAHPPGKQALLLLRSILQETELDETIKWGAPCYTLNGKNVVGMAAFKSYVGLWFHQGVFLKDPKKVLINANENNTRGLRQWRFTTIKEIDPKLVMQYVKEAIANEKSGNRIKPVKAKKIKVPDELKKAMDNDVKLCSKFEQLTPGRQREYSEYIGEAKQEKTRLNRLEKCVPLIIEGKGLNDKYKK